MKFERPERENSGCFLKSRDDRRLGPKVAFLLFSAAEDLGVTLGWNCRDCNRPVIIGCVAWLDAGILRGVLRMPFHAVSCKSAQPCSNIMI